MERIIKAKVKDGYLLDRTVPNVFSVTKYESGEEKDVEYIELRELFKKYGEDGTLNILCIRFPKFFFTEEVVRWIISYKEEANEQEDIKEFLKMFL